MCTCVIDRAQGGASPNETEGGSLFTVLVSSGTTVASFPVSTPSFFSHNMRKKAGSGDWERG